MSVGDLSTAAQRAHARRTVWATGAAWRRHRRRWPLAAAAALAVATIPAARAAGQTLYYTHAAGGDWFTGADAYKGWRFDASGSFAFSDLPAAGSNAMVLQNGTNGIGAGTVTLNFAYAATSGLRQLLIDSGNTVVQNSGTSAMVIALEEIIGTSGIGTYAQNGGAHTIAGGASGLYIGQDLSASGLYILNGGSLSVGAATPDVVGYFGQGGFTQGGGTHNASILYLGYGVSGTSQSHGNYNFSNGALNVDDSMIVGFSGVGFMGQSGGTATVANLVIGHLANGTNAAGQGTYDMTGGTLHVTSDMTVGNFGFGTFVNRLAGGKATIDGTMYIGRNGGIPNFGAVHLYTGTTTANFMLVTPTGQFLTDQGAAFNFGSFTQTGGLSLFGSAVGSADLVLNGAVSTTPSYNLIGGQLTVNGDTYVGYSPTGAVNATFAQSGGIHDTGALHVGFTFAGNTGSYSLTGGALHVSGSEYIGGNGSMTQSGGTNSIPTPYTNGLCLGFNAAETGTYNLQGGTLSLPTGEIYVGYYGNGVYNQSGGIATAYYFSTGYNFLTPAFVASGTANLSGGLLTVTNGTFVGYSGNGVFNHSGGTHNANGLVVGTNLNGTNPASVGVYNMSNGATLNQFGDEQIGSAGKGTFNQTGGTHAFGTAAGNLIIGYLGTNGGTYNLSGGTLTLPFNSEYVGYFGIGVFNQSGGTHTLNSSADFHQLQIGSQPSGTGTYNLLGGILSLPNGEIDVGARGQGIFNQSGGSATTFFLYSGEAAYLGDTNRSNGVINQTGGTMTVFGQTYVGYRGDGAYNQSGGTHSTSALTLGAFPNGTNTAGSGNYSMSNSAVLKVSGSEYVGDNGVGFFTHTGGTHTIGGSLVLGNGSNALGAYSLSADTGPSTLAVTGDEYVGRLAVGGWFYGGNFTQSGGNHTIGTGVTSSSLYVGYGSNATGQYSLSGGSLTTTGNEYFGYNGQGTYTQSGGTNQINGTAPLPSGMIFGYTNGASGTGSLSGGTLHADYQEYVGYFGTGTFTQSGGSNSAQYVTMGWQPGGNGTYTLSGGVLTTTGGTYIGYFGTGSFWQSGGTHVASYLFDGDNPGPGTYTMTNGTLTVLNDAYIGASGGSGNFNQFGGTTTINGGLYNGNGGVNGSVTQKGGTLNAAFVVNNSDINIESGVANFGPVTGGFGRLYVGGGTSGSALVTVKSFSQADVSVWSSGTMVVSHNSPRVTNTVTILSILGDGVLDLGNNALLANNVGTSESMVRQDLHNGYNAGGGGIGDWLGKGGMTSADAIASHNGPSPDFHISVGYVNGAYANDPLIGGSIPGQPGLPTNRILIRPALYGDYNLDGKVDDTDLAIFSGLGQYNQPTDHFGWLGGDLNYDGKVDDTDLLIFSGAGNYNGPSYGAAAAGAAPAHASATPSLTGHTEANGEIVLSASTSQGAPGDGVLDFVYDPSTGHLTLSYDGDPRVTAAQPFQVVRFKSAGGHFIPANFNQTDFGAGVTATTAALNGTASGSNSVPDGYDMGAVLPTGLTVADLTSDLTLQWNVFGGGLTLKNGDVVVPEPAAMGAICAAAAILLHRRRRRPHRRNGR